MTETFNAIKTAVFRVSQTKRLKILGETIIPWINDLQDDEKLVFLLPAPHCGWEEKSLWDECLVIDLYAGNEPDFFGFIEENARTISYGPSHNELTLTDVMTGFACFTVSKEFDTSRHIVLGNVPQRIDDALHYYRQSFIRTKAA